MSLQNSEFNASLQQLQLSAASSLQKRELETSRLEGVVENLRDELSESHHRLKSLERELSQRDDQLTQLTDDLTSCRLECRSKSDEVSSYSLPLY